MRQDEPTFNIGGDRINVRPRANLDSANYRARVFISCGQADEEEKRIAGALREFLIQQGFDPYVATEEQSLRGLKENIFRQLETSEYMVFIDFRREELIGQKGVFRGSLFSNQELAVAAFLNIDVIVLRERGVELNGIMQFIQGNAVEFADRSQIIDLISHRLSSWSPTWQSGLSLIDELPSTSRACRRDFLPNGDQDEYDAIFHHVTVSNRHHSRAAVNCYVFLIGILDCSNSRRIQLETVESKWAGYVFPNALIAPKSFRKFDVFYVPDDWRTKPTIRFNLHTDSTEFIPIEVPQECVMTYRVVSENFPTVAASFHVSYKDDPRDLVITAIEDVEVAE